MKNLFTVELPLLLLALHSSGNVAKAEPPVRSSARADNTPISAQGPLRVHPTNTRYFTDGSGKIIFLTGSHTWGNFQDYSYLSLPSPPAFDFDGYLEFLWRHQHNFVRLWVWETAFNPDAKQGSISYTPLPYERPGPGMALDGDPKFDLTRFDQRYFDRLRARVAAAGKKGIYVSVMLFNGFSIEGKGNVSGDPFSGHPLNRENNVNGVGAAKGQALHTLSDPAITKFQESYVKKVIDSVNDLDNVLYEITNEDSGTPADIAWQIYLVALIKRYERSLAKQHPVGMTACWPSGRDEFLRNGPADWISPAARLSVSDGRKVVLNDTDHSYFWTDLKKHGPADQVAWVWKNFTCGNQCLFMDPYLDPSHDPGRNSPAGNQPDAYWEPLRQAMGQTRAWSERLDLALAAPHPELASSQFCLANPGKEYLVFLPAESEVSLDLSGVDGTFQGEWIHLAEGRTTPTEPVPGGSRRALKAPFSGDAVLFLQVK